MPPCLGSAGATAQQARAGAPQPQANPTILHPLNILIPLQELEDPNPPVPGSAGGQEEGDEELAQAQAYIR